MFQRKDCAPRLPSLVLVVLAALLVATAACSGGTSAGAAAEAPAPGRDDGTFTGSPAEVRQLVAYYKTIRLTPEQEAVRVAALSALPAPCCSNFSAATCCCECNMARATWGLAKHLIAEQGYGVEEVRQAVQEWHRTVSPDGFSGRACFTGGCGRAFRHDGCGGMVDGELIF